MKVFMPSPRILWTAVLFSAVVLAGCKKEADSPYNANAIEQNKEFAKKQAELANDAALAKHPLSQVRVNIEQGQSGSVQGTTATINQDNKN